MTQADMTRCITCKGPLLGDEVVLCDQCWKAIQDELSTGDCDETVIGDNPFECRLLECFYGAYDSHITPRVEQRVYERRFDLLYTVSRAARNLRALERFHRLPGRGEAESALQSLWDDLLALRSEFQEEMVDEL